MSSQLVQISQFARRAAQQKNWPLVRQGADQFLAIAPELPEGHFLVGLAESVTGSAEAAMTAFEKALALDAGRYDAAIELANLLAAGPDGNRALELADHYQSALTNSPKYLDMAGTVYSTLDLPDKAWPLYEKACQLQPEIELFQANLAACAVHLGRIDQAEDIYKTLLAKRPDHQRNHFHLSRLRTVTDESHIREMLTTLNRLNLPPERNVFLYFALGKEYEDLADWRHAFSFYQRGGDAINRVSRYDVEEDIEIISAISETCTPEWLKNRNTSSSTPTPLFVLGLPRTGSTLTERIITNHSQVSSIGETRHLENGLRKLSGIEGPDRMNPEMIRAAAKSSPAALAEEYMSAVAYHVSEEPFFLEKLPYNFLYAGFISRAFPDARIIYVDRHPMDACFAMYKQVFTWAYQFSYSLESLADYYIAHRRLLSQWQDQLDDQWITVKYESMVANQESETRTLLDALGLGFEPQCLDIQSNQSASTTASSVQVREAVHTRSVGKWQHFRQELEPLYKRLLDAGIDGLE